jgi:hypothetical protein
VRGYTAKICGWPLDRNSANPAAYRFGSFEFDPETSELRKKGLRVRLEGQVSVDHSSFCNSSRVTNWFGRSNSMARIAAGR